MDMKQVFTDGQGAVVIREVPVPELRPQTALTRTAYSLISTGTETMAILGRRANPDSERPDAAIGYTNSGVVVQAGPGMEHLSPGDRVGCYGSTFAPAGHAENSLVSRHLCIPVPGSVSLRQAAFTGLGGIAVQAVRQARLSFGETAVVVGLGVLGQLVARICVAAGYRVIATDLLDSRARIAREEGVEAYSDAEAVSSAVARVTEGHGADAVLLCVATKSSEPVRQALEWVRFHGRVVIVGVAQLDVDRNQFFSKEAEITISRAAGPGRYDESYEKDAVDLPYPLVRWSEGRNLQEFIRLVSERRVVVDDLISHEFPLAEAAAAFAQILERPSETLAVLLRYGGCEDAGL